MPTFSFPARRTFRLAYASGYSSKFCERVMLGVKQACIKSQGAEILNGRSILDFLSSSVAEQLIRANEVDGVICHQLSERTLALAEEKNVAVVSTSNRLPRHLVGTPSVISDDHAVGKMAADYFLRRGYSSFGYVGIEGYQYSLEREAGFAEGVASSLRAGAVQSLNINLEGRFTLEFLKHNEVEMRQWAKLLPLPCAVFCCMDQVALYLQASLLETKIRIPEDLAILGVDNEVVAARMAPVELSSIEPGCFKIGERAGLLAMELAEGGPPPSEPIKIAPLRVVERHSTDRFAVADPTVEAALIEIERDRESQLSVETLARRTGVSRRGLERAFQRVLGIAPHQAILRRRLERGRELLLNPCLNVSQVSDLTGFRTQSDFGKAFRHCFGQSPSEFRNTCGRGAEELGSE